VCVREDGTDGKQARRTNTSSPLGELFDHGLDSWASMLMPVAVYSVFGRGDHSISVERSLYIFMGVMFTFLCSHWEKYNTGVLFLPWGYDISQLVRTDTSPDQSDVTRAAAGTQIPAHDPIPEISRVIVYCSSTGDFFTNRFLSTVVS